MGLIKTKTKTLPLRPKVFHNCSILVFRALRVESPMEEPSKHETYVRSSLMCSLSWDPSFIYLLIYIFVNLYIWTCVWSCWAMLWQPLRRPLRQPLRSPFRTPFRKQLRRTPSLRRLQPALHALSCVAAAQLRREVFFVTLSRNVFEKGAPKYIRRGVRQEVRHDVRNIMNE